MKNILFAILLVSSAAAGQIDTTTEGYKNFRDQERMGKLIVDGLFRLATPNGLFPVSNYFKNSVDPVQFGADNDSTSHDDTPALQAAIDYVASRGGGEVVITGYMNLRGALKHSVSGADPNAQVVLPLVQAGSLYYPMVVIKGRQKPNLSAEIIPGLGRNKWGAIIESHTLDTGFVFGAASYNVDGLGGPVNYAWWAFENIEVRVRSKTGNTEVHPTMSGIDAHSTRSFNINGTVKVTTQSSEGDVLSPYNGGTYGTVGLWLPHWNNNANIMIDHYVGSGFQEGVIGAEHMVINDLTVSACYNALYLPLMYHDGTITQFTTEGCVNHIYVSNESGTPGASMDVTILNYKPEHYAISGHWNTFSRDVYFADTATNTRIKIFAYHIVESFVGRTDNFVTNCPQKTYVFNRTFGVNSIIDWAYGGGDYRIPNLQSADASQMLLYDNTNNKMTYGPAVRPPTITILADSFNRSNSSSIMGNLDKPSSLSWNPTSGTWGINSNKAYCASAVSSGAAVTNKVIVNSGKQDFTYQGDVYMGTSTSAVQIIYRYSDANNEWTLGVSSGGLNLYKKVAGSYTVVHSYAASLSTNTKYTIKVIANGASHNVYLNGSLITALTTSDLFNYTATTVGLGIVSGSGLSDNTDRFDNLFLKSLGSTDSLVTRSELGDTTNVLRGLIAAGGGGSSQNIDQVLNTGNSLTTDRSLNIGANAFSINSNIAGGGGPTIYNANSGGRASIFWLNNRNNTSNNYMHATLGGASDGASLFGLGNIADWAGIFTGGSNNNGLFLGTTTSKPLIFGTNNTPRYTIDGSGNHTFTLGSDATGDMFYRNSSGYFTRLPTGTAKQSLHPDGSGGYAWKDTTGIITYLEGDYTPTITNVTNIDATAAYTAHYIRTGNTVNVFGEIDIDPTTTGITEIRINLPISGTFSITGAASGVATASDLYGQSFTDSADITNNALRLKGSVGDISSRKYSFVCSYKL